MKILNLTFIVLFLSCNMQPKKQLVELLPNQIVIDSNLEKVLQQFVDENPCKNCINKVYINKVYSAGKMDHKTIITIDQTPFSKDVYKGLKPAPLLKLNICSTSFFIYCGIEDYFLAIYDNSPKSNGYVDGRFVRWTVIERKDSIVVNKNGELPFSPFTLPEEGFLPSDLK